MLRLAWASCGLRNADVAERGNGSLDLRAGHFCKGNRDTLGLVTPVGAERFLVCAGADLSAVICDLLRVLDNSEYLGLGRVLLFLCGLFFCSGCLVGAAQLRKAGVIGQVDRTAVVIPVHPGDSRSVLCVVRCRLCADGDALPKVCDLVADC